MKDKRYKRTTGGKNKESRRYSKPVISEGIATLKCGTKYVMRADGWRRLPKD